MATARTFEAVVGLMLDSLQKIYPEAVEVRRRPRIGDATVDFELAGRGHGRCLIECEDSGGDFERILPRVKKSRPGDRVLFLYHFARSLPAALRSRLAAGGVEPMSLVELGVFLDRINCRLAAGTAAVDEAVFRLELMKGARRYPALRTAISRMRHDAPIEARVGA